MNCFLETIASIWMLSVRTAIPGGQEESDDETGVHYNLEGCRNSLEAREMDLAEACKRLGREALKRKQAGDVPGAKIKIMERKRACKRLDKLRSSLALVDAQLDALRTTELDKELMRTLQASSAALKQAGVGTGFKDAEEVMMQLDEQMRQSSELTSVLSGPLQEDMDFDLEEELNSLMHEGEAVKAPGTVNSISPVREAPHRAAAPMGPVATVELVVPSRVQEILF